MRGALLHTGDHTIEDIYEGPHPPPPPPITELPTRAGVN